VIRKSERIIFRRGKRASAVPVLREGGIDKALRDALRLHAASRICLGTQIILSHSEK